MKLKSKVMIRLLFQLFFKIIFLEMLIFIGELYRSHMDLIQIFCKDNITANGIISMVILIALIALMIQKFRIEVSEKTKEIFLNVQRTINAGKFVYSGNLPMDTDEYEKVKQKVFIKMKEHKVVSIFFSDDKLKNFIEKQYEELFKITNTRPVGKI